MWQNFSIQLKIQYYPCNPFKSIFLVYNGIDWTSIALSCFTDVIVLGLAVAGALIGGIFITLAAGYLFLKR